MLSASTETRSKQLKKERFSIGGGGGGGIHFFSSLRWGVVSSRRRRRKNSKRKNFLSLSLWVFKNKCGNDLSGRAEQRNSPRWGQIACLFSLCFATEQPVAQNVLSRRAKRIGQRDASAAIVAAPMVAAPLSCCCFSSFHHYFTCPFFFLSSSSFSSSYLETRQQAKLKVFQWRYLRNTARGKHKQVYASVQTSSSLHIFCHILHKWRWIFPLLLSPCCCCCCC